MGELNKYARESKELAEKYGEARALDEGLHRIFRSVKESLGGEPPPKDRERLAKNVKRAMRRLMSKRYRKTKVRKFVEKIKRGYTF